MDAEACRRFFDRLAPTWDSNNRYNPVSLAALYAALDLRPGLSCLDVGTGTGVLLPELARRVGPSGLVVAADLSPQMVAAAARKRPAANIDCRVADATRDDFGGRRFDRIILHNVLAHFADIRAGLGHLAGLLRPGGRIAVCHSDGRDTVNARHHRSQSVREDILPPAADLAAILRQLGLAVDRVADAPHLFLVTADRTGGSV